VVKWVTGVLAAGAAGRGCRRLTAGMDLPSSTVTSADDVLFGAVEMLGSLVVIVCLVVFAVQAVWL